MARGLWWLLGGTAGLGALVLSLDSKRRSAVEQEVEAAVGQVTDWLETAIRKVTAHEGNYDSLNLNTDNAGLSFGIMQWAQRTGALGILLKAMQTKDPQHFVNVFGTPWAQLLDVTARGSLEPVGGALLWVEPWITRFRSAGRDPVFQAVQNDQARNGPHMQAAIVAARTLGVPTERGVTLAFDTSNQQGPSFAKSLAEKVAQSYAGKSVIERLTAYAQLAPVHFRTTQEPQAPHPNPNLAWRQVGTEWHVFAGQIDLYTDILRRRLALVKDPSLHDTVVQLA